MTESTSSDKFEDHIINDPICRMQVETDAFTCEYKGRHYYFCSQGCKDTFELNPEEPSRNYVYDLVIVGGGPAGITAAVYASILRIHTFLITKDIGGQAIDSTKIKNYMGFDFITGAELAKKFKDQFLNRHYLEHKMDEVIKINSHKDGFEILTKQKDRLLTRAVIIASGMKRRRLGIPGEERLLRKGVSHSSLQDTSLFTGKRVVVVGGGNSGIQTAKNLLQADCRVTLVEKAHLRADASEIDALKKHPQAEILERYDVVEIIGDEKVEAVMVQSMKDLTKKKIPCEGVFIQVGLTPNTPFCEDLLELNQKGEIKTFGDCSTSVEGVFACGDVTDVFAKRIIIASGEGAKAALKAKKFLSSKTQNQHIKSI